MRTQYKVILIIMFFVVLMIPIKVGASVPPEAYPVGIVIDIDSCSESEDNEDTYIVDIVVPRVDVADQMSTTLHYTDSTPEDLKTSAYRDVDNEWISAILYLDEAEWRNEVCRTTFYSYAYTIEEFPFSEYKVVVYEEGHEPVESPIYQSSQSATQEEPGGYKTVYDSSTQTFARLNYEAEIFRGNTGEWDGIIIFIIIVFIILISAFVLMESFIYLVSRQGWRAVLLTLGINASVLLIVVIQTVIGFRNYRIVFMILGLVFVPGIYTIKVLLINKYAARATKVSILISVVYFVIYFYYTVVLNN